MNTATATSPATIYVATFYRFVQLPDFSEMRGPLLDYCKAHDVYGTILLANEGINSTIAGTSDDLEAVFGYLRTDPRLADIEFRLSDAGTMPFKRMKVKLKKEIVTLGVEGIDPNSSVGTYVKPEEWNALISEPDVVLIDSRNDYEYAIGSFEGAIDPETASFRELPAWVEQQDFLTQRPRVAMFCTGGIRCEKSTAYMLQQGFKDVYHLEGGILNYLDKVPEDNSLWHGDCFVYDERVSVTHGLKQGKHRQLCPNCGRPVFPGQEQGDTITCRHCSA